MSNPKIALLCLDTNQKFASIKEAGIILSIARPTLVCARLSAIARGRNWFICKGFEFEFG